jgi:two-component system NtrC family response regulator
MFCEALESALSRLGHEVSSAHTLDDGIQRATSGKTDLVLLDVRMPDGNGLDALPRIRAFPESPEVIIITGLGDPDGAELAIKSGAWDYIEKASSLKEMTLPVIRALEYRQEKMSRRPTVALKRYDIVGEGARISACLDRLAIAAGSDAPVLITGQTGTGKELFALAIHKNSERAEKNFVVVDCATLPESLVESVLFGHEKGSFTGAVEARDGLILQANEGTLFLDEIGDLSPDIQKSFLRVLQSGCFRPIGSRREMKSNFRVIAATHRPLEKMVRSGDFREDLLFRLRAISIELPPLCEREEDIRDLTRHHVSRICERYGCETKGICPEFFEVLESYEWPGNVRELVNTLESSIAEACYEPTLFPKHLPTRIRVAVARDALSHPEEKTEQRQSQPPAPRQLPKLAELRESSLADAEKRYLKDLMAMTHGNMDEAQNISGVSRSRLYALLQKYDLSPRSDQNG